MMICKTTTLVLALSLAGMSFAATPTVSQVGVGARAPLANPSGLTVLYDQSGDDSTVGIVSQNFQASFDSYDSQAADDFVVPAGSTWTVNEVDVFGQYAGGPADSENITIYKDKKGMPGEVVANFKNLKGIDASGTFTVTLPKKGVKLNAGRYWISVQINMDWFKGGQWFWENRTNVVGKPALWRNPGDGYGSGCVKYTNEQTCVPVGVGDHMFVLKGNAGR